MKTTGTVFTNNILPISPGTAIDFGSAQLKNTATATFSSDLLNLGTA